jgi:hypothetical protein
LQAGCKHKGFFKDALKGLVGFGGAAAGAISNTVSAAMVKAAAFLSDEQKMVNAKKLTLNVADMALTTAQAACAVVSLAGFFPGMQAPAAAVSAACKAASVPMAVAANIGAKAKESAGGEEGAAEPKKEL